MYIFEEESGIPNLPNLLACILNQKCLWTLCGIAQR